MPDILEFNPNRELTFNPNRDRDFDLGRKLLFDPSRHLGFDPERDLPFGKRGVVFRGFICPICGASVTQDQPSCTDCGAVFDREVPTHTNAPHPPPTAPIPRPPPMYGPPLVPASSPVPPPPHVPAAPSHRPPPPVRAYPPAPKHIDVHNCPFCGARVATSDAFCWNCGNRMYSQGR